MCTDFVFQVKCTIFWLKRGLRVHLDLYAPEFPNSISKYLILSKIVRTLVFLLIVCSTLILVQQYLEEREGDESCIQDRLGDV